jgi:hypothetical protein
MVAVLGWLIGGRPARGALLLVLWTTHTLGAALVGGDWMPGGRLLVPSLPWLAVAAELGGRALFTARPRLRQALLTATLGVYAVVSASESVLLAHTSSARREYDPVRVRVARSLEARGVRSIGTFDVGVIGYAAARVRILDLGGLTDRTVAASPGAHARKEIPDEYLLRAAPDAWLFTSRMPSHTLASSVSFVPYFPVEQSVMTRPWFAERYRYAGRVDIRDDYQLHVFLRTRVGLPQPASPRPE